MKKCYILVEWSAYIVMYTPWTHHWTLTVNRTGRGYFLETDIRAKKVLNGLLVHTMDGWHKLIVEIDQQSTLFRFIDAVLDNRRESQTELADHHACSRGTILSRWTSPFIHQLLPVTWYVENIIMSNFAPSPWATRRRLFPQCYIMLGYQS